MSRIQANNKNSNNLLTVSNTNLQCVQTRSNQQMRLTVPFHCEFMNINFQMIPLNSENAFMLSRLYALLFAKNRNKCSADIAWFVE